MEVMLDRLKARGQWDLLERLWDKRLDLRDVFDAYEAGELERLTTELVAPPLRTLVDEWLASLPTALNRLHRRYAPETIRRYKVNWNRLLDALPEDAKLSDLTKGFLLDYRQTRKVSPATINRDMIAVQALLTWAAERYNFERPEIPKEHEAPKRLRHLSRDEIDAFRESCSDEWWPFWSTLLHTGMRWGECAGLCGGDVSLRTNRIVLHEGVRRLKTGASSRTCAIAPALQPDLAAHYVRYDIGPADPMWPFITGSRNGYDLCRDVWAETCLSAGIKGATIKTLRDTFGVRAAMAGIPLVAIMRLMGHTNIATTQRYMDYAPSEHLDEYAAAIADVETEAREEKAREGVKPA
jgi:integrase/recombinase XerD